MKVESVVAVTDGTALDLRPGSGSRTAPRPRPVVGSDDDLREGSGGFRYTPEHQARITGNTAPLRPRVGSNERSRGDSLHGPGRTRSDTSGSETPGRPSNRPSIYHTAGGSQWPLAPQNRMTNTAQRVSTAKNGVE